MAKKFIVSPDTNEVKNERALEIAAESDGKQIFTISAAVGTVLTLTGAFRSRGWRTDDDSKSGEHLSMVSMDGDREVLIPISSFISKSVKGIEGETLCKSVFPEFTPRTEVVQAVIDGTITKVEVGSMLVTYSWGEASRQYLINKTPKSSKKKES